MEREIERAKKLERELKRLEAQWAERETLALPSKTEPKTPNAAIRGAIRG